MVRYLFYTIGDLTYQSPLVGSKNSPSNFMRVCPMGAELFHMGGRAGGRTDRQTDIMKLIVAFRNFAKAPTKC